MIRKKFLLTTMAALPAFFFAKAAANTAAKDPFIVRAFKNRSGEPMMKFMGMHPNDVVISGKDTNNEFSVFLFHGNGIVGTPLHVHFHQD
ncbi:MAG: hypothetical protein ACFCU6_13395 [Balneolaceae bacterium]